MARGSTLVQWKSRHIGRFVCGFGAIAGGADAKQIFESADLRVGYSHAYHNWAWTGGAFQLGFNLRWAAVKMHTCTNQVQYLWFSEGNHLSNIHWHLPLRTMDEAAGRNNKIWKDWIDHPGCDNYWQDNQSVENRYADIEVPIYGLGRWFDVFLQGTFNNFMGVKREGSEPGKSHQKVFIGPWIHDLGGHGTETKVGDMDFGHTVLVNLRNEWRTASDWPIPGTDYVPYYLHTGGNANSLFGDVVSIHIDRKLRMQTDSSMIHVTLS